MGYKIRNDNGAYRDHLSRDITNVNFCFILCLDSEIWEESVKVIELYWKVIRAKG